MEDINWLWVVGGVAAAWLVVRAMGRRQSRLTEVLRNHVERVKDQQKPAVPTDAADSPSES